VDGFAVVDFLLRFATVAALTAAAALREVNVERSMFSDMGSKHFFY
jgi:hypothetical protein